MGDGREFYGGGRGTDRPMIVSRDGEPVGMIGPCSHAGTITRRDASGRTTCTACGAIFPPPIVMRGEFEGTTDEEGDRT